MAEYKEIKYLGNIKSSYIIKGIFLFLNEKQKLSMIIYNKQLQKILGVDIKVYKEISGKYKITIVNIFFSISIPFPIFIFTFKY